MFQQELPIIAAFLVFVTVLLIIDLVLFNKKAHSITVKESALMSVLWLPTWLLIYQRRSLERLNFWWLLGMLISGLALGQSLLVL